MVSERGIVIGSYWQVESSGFTHGAPGYMPAMIGDVRLSQHRHLVAPAIRRSILYFDHIEWPITNADLPLEIPGLDVLLDQGLVHRTPLTLRRGADPRSAALYVFDLLEASQPGIWDFARLVDHEPYYRFGLGEMRKLEDPPTPDAVVKRAIEFELYDALPVPAPHVHFAEVLDFRDRRAPELGAMRERMDELYAEVVDSNDVPRAKVAALEHLDRAIGDVAAAMNASKLDAIWRSIKIDLLLETAATASLGKEAAELAHGNVVYAAALGAAVGAYRFLRKQASSPENRRAGPFTYIESASAEKIVQV
jgi:hypothetical protein